MTQPLEVDLGVGTNIPWVNVLYPPLGLLTATPRALHTHATIVRSLTIDCYEFLCSFKRKDKIKCAASPLRVHLNFF